MLQFKLEVYGASVLWNLAAVGDLSIFYLFRGVFHEHYFDQKHNLP